MIKQNWSISQEEKNRILNLHESATKNQYLLREETDPNKISFNISKSFPSGKFILSDTSEIDDSLSKIQKMLETGDGSFDTIIINSSESKVPNRGVGLETGELSKKRGEEVEKYIKSKIGNSINVRVNDLGSQGPEWDVSKGSKHPDYTKHQFVNLTLSGEKKPSTTNVEDNVKSICDYDLNETRGQGEEINNYITLDDTLKDYGYLTIDTGSIPDRMIVLNREKTIVADTGYIATKPHQYKNFKYVPLYVYQLTLLNQVKKNISVSGNKLITVTVNSFEELMSKLLVNPKTTPSNERIVKMGGEVSDGITNLKNLFRKGIRTFVFYSIGDLEIGKIPFDSRKGDYNVIVYSPVGQTGYTIKGFCPKEK
jgi:hypothetical protein